MDNSLQIFENYDVIGLDECFVKWDERELTKLVCETHLRALSDSYPGYPDPEVYATFKYNTDLLLSECTVWDIEHGALLKITEG